MRYIVSILFTALLLTACQSKNTEEASPKLQDNPQEDEVREGDFVFRLVSEKQEYGEFEKPEIYAKLTYVGDKKEIQISHAASLFSFPIHEQSRGYTVDYAMDTPLLITNLKRGEPYRESYEFAGGYSDQDDEDYVAFVQSIIDHSGFPKGDYSMEGYADFSVVDDSDTSDKEIKMKLQISFDVE
ncbi:hypothetical protein [Sporosarcina sp. Te-1]|uniref:hypothetical protein n=1 Tax=Sporosarcina sp. Te-1 TaxID=2818390 RepID=UPI001A9D87F4|nr:hypothetical protein [Sporosarcina sp. Te-1]QTD41492.1 hypothetical protein J3U78_01085 [Sporosarcina sp. Te-1]